MSIVKNEPKYKNKILQAIREQLEHRALWLYLLCDEAKKRGLDPSLIQDALLKVDSNEEFQRALAKAIQIEKSQRNMSYKQKVYDIKQKLVSEGFTNCDEVVEKLNLS